MHHHLPSGAALAVALLALASCGSSPAPTAQEPSAPPAATPVAQPPAPATAGALTYVPDTRAARQRLGYADRARLRAAGLPAGRLATAVVGDTRSQVVLGARRRTFTPGDLPETTVIAPGAVSAVQSCLGDAAAQTVLGPATMGDDAAIGAGAAATADGSELRLCFAPRLIRNVHQSETALERRFGGVGGARVGGTEIGEREIMTATVPVTRVRAGQLTDLVAGGTSLRRLAPWD